ncbi:hypothetical protein Talka_00097 [Tepidimonas alkaliphilus]|uniref:UPF0235 protein Talka_00097 n=1 Tax=Tepidimonas alkaliphilus TaxID=2588942 RepID=A0A554WCX3_9BURK|nr:DUF167 domain-containing protein [Tepidimonas alkaliphilus]TSE21429.1 hypothetical protein Talka_00097 [Tepidimonas alkaliphilus]
MAKRDPNVTAALTIYCQPGARQTRLAGLHGGLPKIQLAAPPVDSAANEALIAFVAERCGVPRSCVRIVRGHTSRTKRLAIDGLDNAGALQAMQAS